MTKIITRRGFMGAAGVACATLLAGCGPASSDDTTTDDTETTSSETLGDGVTLRVGMEAAYAPFNWQTSEESDTTIPIDNVDGAYADGYDVQVAKVIAEALGMEPVAVKLSFDGLIDALNNGQIDIICAGMTATEERAQAADFSDTYLDDGVCMVTLADSEYASATKLSDFSGASVMGQSATLYDEVIDQIEGVNHLTPAETVPLVVENLSQGIADAITYSTASLPKLLETYPNFVQVPLEEEFEDADNTCNAAIAKGQDAVLAKVNEAIGSLSQDDRDALWADCMERQPA